MNPVFRTVWRSVGSSFQRSSKSRTYFPELVRFPGPYRTRLGPNLKRRSEDWGACAIWRAIDSSSVSHHSYSQRSSSCNYSFPGTKNKERQLSTNFADLVCELLVTHFSLDQVQKVKRATIEFREIPPARSPSFFQTTSQLRNSFNPPDLLATNNFSSYFSPS